jgi:hypothetical protein
MKDKLKKLALISGVALLPGGVIIALALLLKKKKEKDAKLP